MSVEFFISLHPAEVLMSGDICEDFSVHSKKPTRIHLCYKQIRVRKYDY
jgi:hypothetical protein